MTECTFYMSTVRSCLQCILTYFASIALTNHYSIKLVVPPRKDIIHQVKINFYVVTAVDFLKKYQFGRLLFRYWE